MWYLTIFVVVGGTAGQPANTYTMNTQAACQAAAVALTQEKPAAAMCISAETGETLVIVNDDNGWRWERKNTSNGPRG